MLDESNIITDEMRIELIKRAIQTTEGWKNLALAVAGHEDRIEKCKELLRKIGGDIEYDAPVIGEDFSEIKVKFADMLVASLENNLKNI